MIKYEEHRLTFRYPDGSLIYPGVTVLAWMLVGSVWHLIGMDRNVERITDEFDR